MKKLLSLIIVAMFALSMSLGAFAADDKSSTSTTTKSSSSTEAKPKKSKKIQEVQLFYHEDEQREN